MPIDLPASKPPIIPETGLGGRRPRFFYLVSLPLWLAVVLRSFDADGDADRQPLTLLLLLVYLALFVTGDRLSRRFHWYEHLYFGLQLTIVFAAMVAQPELGLFSSLVDPNKRADCPHSRPPLAALLVRSDLRGHDRGVADFSGVST
ncbi:MAG: hypothetical protein R2848_13300 [Thermomicrobiales bacterium]